MALNGYIKYSRTEQARNLHSNMAANHLLNIVAMRASRFGNPVEGLLQGEAELGDYNKIGMTRGQYRSALDNLVKWGYISVRTTNKGTLAKLVNNDVYDINEDTLQPTSNQQATNKQPTSNHYQEKKEYKELKEKESIKENSLFLEIQLLKSKIETMEENSILLKKELEKEKEKSCAKKEKDTPAHVADILEGNVKPYEIAIFNYPFPEQWTDELKKQFKYYCDCMHERKKGNFGATNAQGIIFEVNNEIKRHPTELIASALFLCGKNGWNFDINFEINKRNKNKKDESDNKPKPVFKNRYELFAEYSAKKYGKPEPGIVDNIDIQEFN